MQILFSINIHICICKSFLLQRERRSKQLTLAEGWDGSTGDSNRFKGKPLGSLFKKSKIAHAADSDSHRFVFEYELNTCTEKVREPAFKFVSDNPSNDDAHRSFDYSSVFKYDESDAFKGANYDPQYKTIFTYSEPLEQDVAKFESGFNRSYMKNNTAFSVLLLFLSSILLLLLLPILCWLFIKKLSKHERVIIIRLGHRLRPKGPGWVVILPFCDIYYRIHLDEQLVKLTRVSGGTKDEALVEVTASVTFRLVELEMAYATTTQSPSQLVTGQGQLCLLSSLTKLTWRDQLVNKAYHDLELETMTSLSYRCGRHGIQVVNVKIVEVTLIRDAPSVETVGKRQASVVGQHLRAFSALLQTSMQQLSANSSSTTNATSTNDGGGTASERSSTSTVISGISHSSKLASGDAVNLPEGSGTPKTASGVTEARNSVCSNAIARAQPFLRNSAACRALDYASLQLIVYASREEIQENGVCADDPELVYFDAGSSRAEMGAFPGSKPPSVTVHIGYEELGEVLSGRLDLMNALNSGLCRVVGDRSVLSKMRFLLYLQR